MGGWRGHRGQRRRDSRGSMAVGEQLRKGGGRGGLCMGNRRAPGVLASGCRAEGPGPDYLQITCKTEAGFWGECRPMGPPDSGPAWQGVASCLSRSESPGLPSAVLGGCRDHPGPQDPPRDWGKGERGRGHGQAPPLPHSPTPRPPP